jgi:dienelactone hydrolase
VHHESFNPIHTVDDNIMEVWVTYPYEAGRYPGILLLNDGFGVNAHIRSVAERLCNEADQAERKKVTKNGIWMYPFNSSETP